MTLSKKMYQKMTLLPADGVPNSPYYQYLVFDLTAPIFGGRRFFSL